MSKGGAPSAPDYVGAARATSQGNIQQAIAGEVLGNPTRITPYGTVRLTGPSSYGPAGGSGGGAQFLDIHGTGGGFGLEGSRSHIGGGGSGFNLPNPGDYTLKTELSPEVQRLFDHAFDPTKSGQDNYYDSVTRRYGQQFGESEDALRQKLATQGIYPGSEAWDKQYRNFLQQKDDTYAQAGREAEMYGTQQQAQEVNTINQILAAMSGSPVSQANTGAGPDYMNALNQQFSAQMGKYNSDQAAASSNTAAGAGATAAIIAAML